MLAVTVTASALCWVVVGALAIPVRPLPARKPVPVHKPPAELVGPIIPKPTGPCPRFDNGLATFAPAGLARRRVQLLVGKRGGGPLVIYWHGMGGRPLEAVSALGRRVVKKITDSGGVVAAPVHDPVSTPYPWYLVSTRREDDLALTDELVGCALMVKHIDPVHIHTLGMSAGGLQASQLGPRRSNYMASIAAYSGGLVSGELTPPFQSSANKFPALLLHGGVRDEYIVNFERTTRDYETLLRSRGHASVVCNHRHGHVIPRGGGAAAYQFFLDHPFGAGALPHVEKVAAVDYCALLSEAPKSVPRKR